MHQEITARRVAHRIQQLSDPILLNGAGEGVVYRIAGFGEGGLAGKVGGHRIQVKGLDQMVGQDMLQKEVESVAVILVAEVASAFILLMPPLSALYVSSLLSGSI